MIKTIKSWENLKHHQKVLDLDDGLIMEILIDRLDNFTVLSCNGEWGFPINHLDSNNYAQYDGPAKPGEFEDLSKIMIVK